jgi:ComF family protein
LVQALKYDDKTVLARPLGEALAVLVEADPELVRADCICPIPLHRARLRERGYNQSELLAREAAGATGKEYAELLVREKNTPTQTQRMGSKERRENLRGAFALAPDADVGGRAVILVDDVTTSGATFDAAGRCLLAGGADALYGLAVAGS